jgi:hypothetical protein
MHGRILNRHWNVNASHPLFSETGNWYHRLRRFPGALFDPKGYVLFKTEAEFLSCNFLNIHEDHIWVPRTISSIPQYVQVIIGGEEYIPPNIPGETRIFFEGAPFPVKLTQYERDRGARDKCLEYYGRRCSICDFDFQETYGELASGMIHVHHLKSIADIGEKYSVDPILDLRPVCPNCHAVIHRRNPPFTVEEVKRMFKNSKLQTYNK